MGKWLNAAEEILRKAGKELHYNDITRYAVDQGLMEKTTTDHYTVNKEINQDIIKLGLKSRFYTREKGSGFFGLKEFLIENNEILDGAFSGGMNSASLTWLEAAKKVLEKERRPLKYTEIADLALKYDYYTTDRNTPHQSVNAIIRGDIVKNGEKSNFVRIRKGVYALRSDYPKSENDEMDSLIEEEKQTGPLNQILYGPPGTGKTYATLEKAVQCAEPAFTPNGNTPQEIRASYRIKYEQLTEEERIHFITFHQSGSYEDFIEGIKPVKPKPDDDFMSYEVKDGILKRLANLAKERKSAANFEEAYQQYIGDVSEAGSISLKTLAHGKTFNVEINSKGSSVAIPQTATGTRMTLTQGLIKDYIVDGVIRDWKPYTTAIGEYIKSEYNVRVETTDNTRKNFVLIIDEINRGNVSQIFGELITLIEDGKRAGQPEALSATLPYSRESFSVPPNLYIIGTMNTADRSVEALDTALRRRFTFEEIAPQPGLLSEDVEGINLKQLLSTINERLEVLIDRDHTIGHAWLMGSNTAQEVAQKFKTTILPLLREYFYNDYSKIGLVLGDAFVKQKNSKSTAKPFATFVAINSGIRKELAERPLFEVSVPADDDTTALVAAFRSVYQQAQPDSSNGNERL